MSKKSAAKASTGTWWYFLNSTTHTSRGETQEPPDTSSSQHLPFNPSSGKDGLQDKPSRQPRYLNQKKGVEGRLPLVQGDNANLVHSVNPRMTVCPPSTMQFAPDLIEDILVVNACVGGSEGPTRHNGPTGVCAGQWYAGQTRRRRKSCEWRNPHGKHGGENGESVWASV